MKDWNGFSHEWADPSVTIGRRIAALMAFRGLSSHKLAPLVGVSHAAICKYRNCEDFPSSKVLIRLASALGVTASVLLGEIRPPKTLEQWEIDWMNAPMGLHDIDNPKEGTGKTIMTVREAFEKAGHRIPRGNKIIFRLVVTSSMMVGDGASMCWFAVGNGEFWFGDTWVHFGETSHHPINVSHSSIDPDLSNLPAIDAYDALPDVVKKVVKR